MDEELQGVPVTAEGEAQAPAQAQTPAKEDDFEVRVNRLLETRLATEVERRVQSELQKRKNRADKQLAEDTRVIERMAQRGLLDEDAKQQQLEAAKKEAEAYRNVWHFEDDDAPPPAPQTQQRQTEPASGPRDDETDFRKFVQDIYGFDPKEEGMDYSKVLNAPPNDPNVKEFQRKALLIGAKKTQEAEQRKQNAERVKKGIDEYGDTGGLSNGNSPPPRNPIAKISDRETLARMAAEEDWKNLKR